MWGHSLPVALRLNNQRLDLVIRPAEDTTLHLRQHLVAGAGGEP